MNEQTPAHAAPEVERAILARMLVNPERSWSMAVEAELSEEYFSDENCRALWQIISEINRSGNTADVPTVMAAVRDAGTLTLSAFSEILAAESPEHTWAGHVAILRDRLARRIAIDACENPESGEMALRALSEARDRLSAVLTPGTALTPAREAARAYLAWIMELNGTHGIPGIPTRIRQLDETTGGIRKGELWIVSGKSSSGKSALMLQFADNAVLDGKSVLIFSLEMNREEIISRAIARRGKIALSRANGQAQFRHGESERVRRIVGEIATNQFAVCDEGGQSIEKICGLAERYAETNGLDLVVVDYIQLVDVQKIRGQSREQEVAQISRRLKQLAKKLNCPVLTGSQLNDDGKTRESRAIENDANVLLEVESGESAECGNRETKILVRKNRNGMRDFAIEGAFFGGYQTFEFDGQ